MAEPRPSQRLLFVYGSLKRGQRHHAELGAAVYVGTARTAPECRLLALGDYPALARGARGVEGELFLIEADALEHLDTFEGDEYVRGVVRLEDGRDALTYWAAPGAERGARERELETWSPTLR